MSFSFSNRPTFCFFCHLFLYLPIELLLVPLHISCHFQHELNFAFLNSLPRDLGTVSVLFLIGVSPASLFTHSFCAWAHPEFLLWLSWPSTTPSCSYWDWSSCVLRRFSVKKMGSRQSLCCSGQLPMGYCVSVPWKSWISFLSSLLKPKFALLQHRNCMGEQNSSHWQ